MRSLTISVEALDRGGPALIIAPHPDDESLGCGGLIAALAARGRRAVVVFITDGGASHLKSRTWDRPRLAAVREAEAREAIRRLGLAADAAVFLGLPDADMPPPGSAAFEDAERAVLDVVEALRPGLVLLPWRRDPHRDHRDSWALATRALAASSVAPDVLEYAIWLDELGCERDHPQEGEVDRVLVDVAATLPLKRAAIGAHVSQHGGLITDDPDGFRLTPETVARLTSDTETYWRSCSATP